MLRNAAALFSNRAADLQSYVYGEVATDTGTKRQVSCGGAACNWLSPTLDHRSCCLLRVMPTNCDARQHTLQAPQRSVLQRLVCCTPAALGHSQLPRWWSLGQGLSFHYIVFVCMCVHMVLQHVDW